MSVVDGPRPGKEEILELRNLMLQSVKLLVKTDSKIEDEELQSIISYLITVPEVTSVHYQLSCHNS